MPRAARTSYGRPRGAAEWKALRLALEIAFEIPPKDVPRWIRRAGPANFRVVREGREVGGGLLLNPFGHWFGGRVVPAFGVAAVGILPDRRARGLASSLMAEALREMTRRGAGVSTLYPATTPVYRRVGYERAGDQVFHSIPVERIEARDREPLVRPARASDRRAIRALHAASSRVANGPIDRTEYFWWRASGHGERGARTWVVDRAGRVEAYFVVEQDKRKSWPGPAYDLWMPDHAFANAAAGRRILSFLAAHRSLAGDLWWPGGLADPILGLLDPPIVDAKRVNRWMLRVVDLARAVERRGFAPGVAVEVALEIEDDLLERNRGRWTLHVADGRGRLVRGGRGRVRVDARGLAPLYTGYHSPFDLRAQGRLDGPDADLARLGAAFAGPAPFMRDGF
jgi:predicted acetyltransferase